MNTTPPGMNVEPRWKTYLKAIGFLLPALVLWQFACQLLFPKLQAIWQNAGATGSDAQWVMNTLNFLVHNGGLIFATVIGVLLFLELRSRLWAHYRRAAVGSVVFLLNSVVMVGLTTMCIAALLAAPALAHAR